MTSDDERAAYVRMLELIGGLQISRALAVVAELGTFGPTTSTTAC